MRFLTLILLMVGLAVFFLQNRQPIPLVFWGGLLKVQLPLAGWVLLFVTAGVLTSLVLQALNALRGSPPSRIRSSSPQFYQPPGPPPQGRGSGGESPTRLQRESPESEWQPQETREEWDDWNLEEAPVKSVGREPADTIIQEEIPEKELPNLEIQQEPQRFTREGSVYSYSYRERKSSGDSPPEIESEKTASRQRDRVYDANYRLLTPPYQNTLKSSSQPEEEDEEWV